MKKNILLLSFMFTAFGLMAQSNKLDKKMEKAQDLVDKGKYNDADEYVVKILNDHPEYGSGWDYLRMIRYKEYKESKQSDNLFSNMTITTTTKDKNGKDVPGGDSLTNALMDMLTKVKPSKVAFNKYIYTLRLGTLMADDAHNCSVYIRTNFIDTPVDTAVSKKALKYFNNAEEEFQKKNYDQAAKLYKRAIDEQPDFYKASLYLGDCYYAMDNYTDAITSFKAAMDRFPNLIEPRKYLVDAYLKDKFFSNALDECISSMKVPNRIW
jgi:tetratricopeptide (TPR) repeat protein